MPVHVLISTWVGSSLGLLTVTKILKDVVLVVGLVMAFLAVDKSTLRKLARDKLAWLIVAYTALTLVMALIRSVEQDAEVLGIVYNLRFLAMFVYATLIISWAGAGFRKRAVRIVVCAGLIVAAFGVIQYTLLPSNALSHLGYSKVNGTPPAFFIDEKPDLERVMSTLKDPNSLGSYLLIIVFLIPIVFKSRRKQLVYVGITLLCLWLTFSRGAVLGLIVATATFYIIKNRNQKFFSKSLRKVLIPLVTILIIVTGGLLVLRHSYLVQNVILHADQKTVLEDPNQLRIRFFKESLARIYHNPFGSGPGTAGIVSIRNQTQGTILNENYYLQIATEVGLLGLTLFLAIIILTAKRLYDAHTHESLALLASLAGLLLTSLLIHTWSNEALAYTWWGLAGLYLKRKDKGVTV
jgi:uncharacterized membrane protein YhaH (DUF805 family)